LQVQPVGLRLLLCRSRRPPARWSVRSQLFLAFVAAVLGGCATPQQKQQQWLAECQQQGNALAAELKGAIEGNRGLDPIRDKINLVDPQAPTPAQLALTSVPSEVEKMALGEWQGTIQALKPKGSAHLQQCAPWDIPISEMSRAAAFSNLADLYTGKISYGQFNRQRQDLATRYVQTSRERAQEIQRQQTQGAEPQAASVAIAGLQNYLIGQQLINMQGQSARIAPFTCTRLGNLTDCY